MYKYCIVNKIKESDEHLDINSLDNTSRVYSKLDINDIPNSNFSKMLYSFTHEDWEQINKTGKMMKTIVDIVTIEIILNR